MHFNKRQHIEAHGMALVTLGVPIMRHRNLIPAFGQNKQIEDVTLCSGKMHWHFLQFRDIL